MPSRKLDRIARLSIMPNRRQTKVRTRKEYGQMLKELVDAKENRMNEVSLQFYKKEHKLSPTDRLEWEQKIRAAIDPYFTSLTDQYITYSLSELQFIHKISSVLGLGMNEIDNLLRKYFPKAGRDRYNGFTCWLCGERIIGERPHKYGLCADCFYGQYYEWNSETGHYELSDMDTADFPMWEGEAFVETLSESEAKAISKNMLVMWKELVLPHLEEIPTLPPDDRREQIAIWKHPWEEYAHQYQIEVEI